MEGDIRNENNNESEEYHENKDGNETQEKLVEATEKLVEATEKLNVNQPEEKLVDSTEKPNIREHKEIPIQVCNPMVKDGLKAFTVYSIKIENNEESIYRRYSDFFCLREKLIERWPGVYIPNIPPKQTMGNLQNKVIEFRMKLLNKFCLKLNRFPSIFNSVEMKTFLSNNILDIKKGLNNLPNQTNEELYTKYKQAFAECHEEYDIAAAKIKINEFQSFLKKALINLRNFKDVVQSSMTKKQLEIDNYLCLISVFSDYEKYTLMEYSESDDSKLIFFNPKNTELCMKLLKLKDGMDNPYSPMFEWLQEEEIDIEAMIEAITSLQMLNDMLDKLITKRTSLEENLNNIQSGKKSLKSFFSFKSKNEEITHLELEKSSVQKSTSDLEGAIKLATYNIESYIEYFKVEKLAGYYENLKMFAELEKINSNMIDELWQTVAKDKNIQKIN